MTLRESLGRLFGGREGDGAPLVQMGNREHQPGLDEVRLGDNSPLYHALMETSEAGVADLSAVREAKTRLAALAESHPEAVAACAGLSPEEAKKKLEEAERL